MGETQGIPPTDPGTPVSGSGSWLSWLSAAVLLAPLTAYLALLSVSSVNVPVWDDFDTVLRFLNELESQDTAGARLELLFSQHNEHRIVFLRVVAAAVRWLRGEIDFAVLTWVGNSGLLLLALALFLVHRTEDPPSAKMLSFAPAALFLFQPQYWVVVLWPTASICHSYVLFFALMTFRSLTATSRRSFSVSLAWAACASGTMANGLLVLPIGLLMLLLAAHYRRAALWIAYSCALVAVYFAGYQPGERAGQLPEGIALLAALAEFSLNFVGSAAGFSRPGLSLILGAFLTSSFGVLCLLGLAKKSPPLFGLFLFCFFSVGSSALGRVQFGSDYSLQERYQLLASIFLVLTYLSWAEFLRREALSGKWVAAGVAVSAGFCAASHFAYRDDVRSRAEDLEIGLLRWRAQGRGLSYPSSQRAAAILEASIQSRIYSIPDELIRKFQGRPVTRKLPPLDPALRGGINRAWQSHSEIFCQGWVHAKGQEREEVLVVFQSSRRTYFFTTRDQSRPDLAREMSPELKGAGFAAIVETKYLDPGLYRIGVYLRTQSTESWLPTDKEVEVGPDSG